VVLWTRAVNKCDSVALHHVPVDLLALWVLLQIPEETQQSAQGVDQVLLLWMMLQQVSHITGSPRGVPGQPGAPQPCSGGALACMRALALHRKEHHLKISGALKTTPGVQRR